MVSDEPVVFLPVARVAVLMRRALREAWPKTRFRVACEGWSLNVSWTDGPTRRHVQRVVGHFGTKDTGTLTAPAGRHFLNGRPARLDVSWVRFERRASAGRLEAIVAHLWRVYALPRPVPSVVVRRGRPTVTIDPDLRVPDRGTSVLYLFRDRLAEGPPAPGPVASPTASSIVRLDANA